MTFDPTPIEMPKETTIVILYKDNTSDVIDEVLDFEISCDVAVVRAKADSYYIPMQNVKLIREKH